MTKQISSIEITFPTAVDLDTADCIALNAVLRRICKRWEAANPENVMWVCGHGSKITYMPMTKEEEDAGLCPTFDDSIYSIEVEAREDYGWPCQKCGIEQAQHKHSHFGKGPPPAGDCNYEPKPKEFK